MNWVSELKWSKLHCKQALGWMAEYSESFVMDWVSEWVNAFWVTKKNDCGSVYLFPDNDQHNEGDDDNNQQHQNSSRHSELWVRTWTHHRRWHKSKF